MQKQKRTTLAQYKDVHSDVVMVTPDLAEEWLSANDNYRNFVNANLQKLKSDLIAGLWSPTPDAIAFDKSGKLFNGQHRLRAIVESGIPAICLVTYKWPTDSNMNPSIDSGAKRNVSTHLSRCGFANASTIASIARTLDKLRRGVSPNFGGNCSDAMVSIIFENSHELERIAGVARRVKDFAASATGAWLWLAEKEGRETEAAYCVDVLSGDVEETSRHPFVQAKSWVLKERAKLRQGRIPNEQQLRVIFSAWEKVKSGVRVSRLVPLKDLSIIKEDEKRNEALQSLY